VPSTTSHSGSLATEVGSLTRRLEHVEAQLQAVLASNELLRQELINGTGPLPVRGRSTADVPESVAEDPPRSPSISSTNAPIATGIDRAVDTLADENAEKSPSMAIDSNVLDGGSEVMTNSGNHVIETAAADSRSATRFVTPRTSPSGLDVEMKNEPKGELGDDDDIGNANFVEETRKSKVKEGSQRDLEDLKIKVEVKEEISALGLSMLDAAWGKLGKSEHTDMPMDMEVDMMNKYIDIDGGRQVET
jgi:hypothetical protein